MGHFSAAVKPVLTINSGDTVVLDTLAGNPAMYERLGVPSGKIPQALKDAWEQVKDKGPSAHILTGPIYINGAEPGDMLEVRIEEIEITVPFAHNANRYGRGTLPDDFPYDDEVVVWLNLEKMTCDFIPGVSVPLKPFFGTMGVAPTAAQGKISSGPPGIHGGNIDCKELVAGSILYLPVHQKGALFSAGDGHGAQGDGEVNRSAVETMLKGKFQFFVHKSKRIKWPRAETPTHYITFGMHEDLDVAAQIALREMIDFLGEAKGIDRTNAYRLSSFAVDLHVTQLVDLPMKGIHAMCPKSIFKSK